MSRKTSGNGLGFKDRKDAHHYHFGDITKSLVSGVASGVSHILHHGHHEHTKEWSTADRMVFEALHAELRAPFNAEDVESTALLHSIWRHLLPDAGDLQLESPLWKSVGCVPLFQRSVLFYRERRSAARCGVLSIAFPGSMHHVPVRPFSEG